MSVRYQVSVFPPELPQSWLKHATVVLNVQVNTLVGAEKSCWEANENIKPLMI